MEMLRWISYNTRKDRIRNEEIRLEIGMTPTDKKIRESCLRLFGLVQRREINALMNKSELSQVKGPKKGRERPKLTLVVVKKDISIKKVTKSMISDRIEWSKRIHAADLG